MKIRLPSACLSALLLPLPALTAQTTGSPPLAPAPSAAAAGTTAPGSNPGAAGDQIANPDQNQAPLQLTPFEVNASQDHGYFSPNTLAGTRLNNNIADIPSSVSVVTKQELLDTNSWNINDVFRYQANTEGASTYTPTPLVRGNVSDVLGQQLLVSGNRVRGLNTADLEVDNYFSLNRIPFDSYNTKSLEIDRGPNSILFGTGSPAGIVNQSRSQAVLNKFSGDLSLVAGSWGTYRETLDLNLPLIRDVLSVYLAQAYTSQGFEQKPSSDLTRRQYAAFTLVPFKSHKTKLSGSFEYYNNTNNDPNAVTPIDFVTPWLSSGRPVYNPLTDTVTYLSSGKVSGPYALTTTMPNYSGILQTALTSSTNPNFVPSLTYVNGGHNVMGIDSSNNIPFFYKGQQTGFSVQTLPNPLSASQALVDEELMTTSVNLPNPAKYQIWQVPSVSSKSIYDWSTVNIDAMSRAWTNAKTYYLDFQQEIVTNLNFDAGWFRQELHQQSDQPLSQANATTLAVDTNAYLLDGRPNPHVGVPYLDAYQTDQFLSPEINNNFRVSLEYELHLEDKVPGWLRWIGHHRFMAVFSQHDDIQTNLRFRESFIGGDPNYLPTAATLANASGYGFGNANNAIEQWYYLSGATGNPDGHGYTAPGRVAQAGIFRPFQQSIETYNYAAGVWGGSNVIEQSVLFPTGGLQENLQDQKTYFWQPFLWDDRIVGTLGINDDQVKNRQTVFPTTNPLATEYNSQGFPNVPVWYREGPWQYVGGNTSTTGFVVHPFRHWAWIDGAADSGNVLAAVARTLSFTFNRSDNFNPPPAFYTDFFGNPLAKPTGKEKDYGLEIATPDNKLFLRATWFNTKNLNQPVSDTSNGRAYYIDGTELKNWATAVVEVRDAGTIKNAAGTPYPVASDPNFGNTNLFPITTDMQAQISALTKLPYTYGPGQTTTGAFANPFETQDGVAHGIEVEAEYNPLPHYRMKLTWGYQRTILSNIANQAAAFVASRQPTWSSYVAPDLTQVVTNGARNTPMYLGDFLGAYGYDGNIAVNSINGWTTTQNYYNIVVAGQLATDRALNGTQAQNQQSYTWSYVTSYDFTEGWLKGFTLGGALRYYGQALAGYYGDTQHLSASGQVFQPDTTQPIYFPHEYHIDAWIAYNFRLPWDNGKIHGQVQLNGSDLNFKGYLQPVTYNYDGSPAAERIIQPRTLSLTTRFSF